MRQLSFSFLSATDQVASYRLGEGGSTPEPTTLQRIDPSRNMARFYRLAVERDLFGNVVLVRCWGRIGTAGRARMDEHPDEGRAVAAMARLEASKRGRGYKVI